MRDGENEKQAALPEQELLARLQRSDDMREFFIEMWKQNPALAKQGGAHVQSLLSVVEPKQRGISLIELIMFIVIVGVAVAGILLVMNVTGRHSADPVIHKQALAIAESVLEEVELMPFTYCDPNDANAETATAAAGTCAVAANEESTVIGPEAGEDRYSTATPFDNVSDYHNFSMSGAGGIKDITGTPISARLDNYSVAVAVVPSVLPNVVAGDALLIKVTVTDPLGQDLVVEGMRTRYAPRTLP